MLKIKDNADLKELEKYGFYYHKICRSYVYDKYDDEIIFISSNLRDISCCGDDGVFYKSINVIFDLIQAGIVKKVGK